MSADVLYNPEFDDNMENIDCLGQSQIPKLKLNVKRLYTPTKIKPCESEDLHKNNDTFTIFQFLADVEKVSFEKHKCI